jgi:copper chaperone CopZ
MSSIKKTYKIQGMDCASCAMVIESDLEDAGFKAKCDFVNEKLEVELENNSQDDKVKKVVEESGYKIINHH